MGSDLFEVGLFKPDATGGEPIMLPRVWDRDTLTRSVPWLRFQNARGRNIYVRPSGEHNLTLVDDLSDDAIASMRRAGFRPAAVAETSPGNFQAWLKHPRALEKRLSTAVARELAQRFGGDMGAADWRHYGRLSGFANRKPKYMDAATGLFPFVKLIDSSGSVYDAAEDFLREVSAGLERQERRRLEQMAGIGRLRPPATDIAKSIEAFRDDPRYGGDGKRADLAYAVYAFSHGQDASRVESAIRSRDLSHKGNERRQRDYVERTIKKALQTAQSGFSR